MPYTLFDRLYWGYRYCFLFLPLLRCFSSGRSPSLSLAAYGNALRREVAFGDCRCKGSVRLPGTFRCLARPSSAPEPSHPPDGVANFHTIRLQLADAYHAFGPGHRDSSVTSHTRTRPLTPSPRKDRFHGCTNLCQQHTLRSGERMPACSCITFTVYEGFVDGTVNEDIYPHGLGVHRAGTALAMLDGDGHAVGLQGDRA